MRQHLVRPARRALSALAATVLLAGLGTGVTSAGAESPAAPTQARTAKVAKVSAAQIAMATPGNFTGHGFDQCLAPTQKAMNAWRKHSPFSAVGIYISGDSRACRSQPNLTPTWVQTQVAKGWRLLPIALGPQAACLSRFPRYKDDFTISPKPADSYALARAQGAAEADKNAADAAALGIGAGSTLWYDLEAFDITNTHCRESALAFVSSWVTRTKELGYVAGYYSSASSGIKIFDDARIQRPGVFALPDRIWIARWDGAANTSTTYIGGDGWRPGGRMKQYRGGHVETWGGVSINIDSNYLDLGTGSRSPGESNCGGVTLGYWTYPTLSSTSAPDTRVKALQCLLTINKLYAGPVDGVWSEATLAAAQAWQVARGRTASTSWARADWISLLAAGNGQVAKLGSTGAHVYRLQRALNAAGAGKFRANGVFNAKTETALRTYQSRTKLTVSGVATAETWKALKAGRG